MIGFTVFSNAQKSARDARRRGDVDAIANALEVNKVATATTYAALADAQFSGGTTPVESNNGSATYCAASSTTAGATPPAKPTTWATTSVCPTSYTTVAGGTTPIPAGTATAWTICALLEIGTNPTVYCKSSAQ